MAQQFFDDIIETIFVHHCEMYDEVSEDLKDDLRKVFKKHGHTLESNEERKERIAREMESESAEMAKSRAERQALENARVQEIEEKILDWYLAHPTLHKLSHGDLLKQFDKCYAQVGFKTEKMWVRQRYEWLWGRLDNYIESDSWHKLQALADAVPLPNNVRALKEYVKTHHKFFYVQIDRKDPLLWEEMVAPPAERPHAYGVFVDRDFLEEFRDVLDDYRFNNSWCEWPMHRTHPEMVQPWFIGVEFRQNVDRAKYWFQKHVELLRYEFIDVHDDLWQATPKTEGVYEIPYGRDTTDAGYDEYKLDVFAQLVGEVKRSRKRKPKSFDVWLKASRPTLYNDFEIVCQLEDVLHEEYLEDVLEEARQLKGK